MSDPTTCWTSVVGAGANDVFYEYDLAGRRKSVRFASTSGQGIVYGYDTAGRMSSEASYGRTLSFGYDPASNRERVTFPDNNFVFYTFDAMNRVDQVRLNNLTSGANLVADYGYDELSRRSSLARGAGNVAASSYGYDPASRLMTLAHDLLNTSADQTWSFGYTPASQLASRTAANDNYRWVGATIANRTYARNGLNQYTNVGGTTYSYDTRGNLTSDGSRTFAYDLENHLTSVNGAAFQLSYDPLGRLRQSVAGAATTEFLYDGDRLVAEYNGAGVMQRRYVHGPGVDEPLMWIEGASMSAGQRWLAADAQGSVVAAADASGALLGAPYAYGPYGEPDSVNLWTGSRFRYTGQIALPEVSLYHYKARVYDPVLGRFLQTDPVGYEDDLNLYQYVGNDPLNRSDPTGNQAVEAAVAACIGPQAAACAVGAAVVVVGGGAIYCATSEQCRSDVGNIWDSIFNNEQADQPDQPTDQAQRDAHEPEVVSRKWWEIEVGVISGLFRTDSGAQTPVEITPWRLISHPRARPRLELCCFPAIAGLTRSKTPSAHAFAAS